MIDVYVVLKPGRERSVIRRHPWLFASAIASVSGNPQSGQTVAVRSSNHQFLGWGSYSPNSQIRVRFYSRDEDELINREFFRKRVEKSVLNRKSIQELRDTNAYRIVYAETDGVPGFIVDRYGDLLVTQFLSAGSQLWQKELVEILTEVTGCKWIYNRSDVDVRHLEGLKQEVGWSYGERNFDEIEIEESGLQYLIPFTMGQKTGFYLDQRLNRKIIRNFARGRNILDCFCYSGAFSLNCLAGGAESITAVDSSSEALEYFRSNIDLNRFDPTRFELFQNDVFSFLRELRDRNKKFDLVVLDPPKFAPTSSQAEKAARGYKDINLLAMKLLNPGGFLATFSCSGGISSDLFQKIIASSALDAGVDVQIIQFFHQDIDHPVSIHFPESSYLKGFLVRIQ